MIEELRHEELIQKVGGRFRFTALIQKRWRELMFGARPLVETGNLTPLEIAIREVSEGKIVPKDAAAAEPSEES